jgi:CRISPR-associated protein Csx10
MKTYTLELILKSSCLIGSGEGFGTLIDSDVVFDEIGIPYIPAKRIKGCLRDSAIEVCEMFDLANINLFGQSAQKTKNPFEIVDFIFGKTGNAQPAQVYFSNLTIENYSDAIQWLKYFMDEDNEIINKNAIINQFAEIRQQTSIDYEIGSAKEHSLRTIRVVKKGFLFKGTIDVVEEIESVPKILYFACSNLKRIGTKRNRGFGKVECKLYENSTEINFLNELERLCNQSSTV